MPCRLTIVLLLRILGVLGGFLERCREPTAEDADGAEDCSPAIKHRYLNPSELNVTNQFGYHHCATREFEKYADTKKNL